MSVELCEEHRQLQDLVARFVDRELMPLEPRIIEREIRGEHPTLTPEEATPLLAKCRELGLWALDVPEEFGGVNLPAVALMAVNEELWRTIVPFTFPPDSPNLHMLMTAATPEQKAKYLEPYARGEAKSCIAVSEPGAGADPSGMTTKAEHVGNGWVVNGRKIWVSRVPEADFIILMARVGAGKRREGITAFIIERGTEGFVIEREIPMIGGHRTYELVFEDMRVPGNQLLGHMGNGFVYAMQSLDNGRMGIAAQAIGIAEAALRHAAAYAAERRQFGKPIKEFQAIQFKLADMATRVASSRALLHLAATAKDRGEQITQFSSMAKLLASETAMWVTTQALQIFGGYGYVKDYPVERLFRDAKVTQIYEGTSEIQKIVIARELYSK